MESKQKINVLLIETDKNLRFFISKTLKKYPQYNLSIFSNETDVFKFLKDSATRFEIILFEYSSFIEKAYEFFSKEITSTAFVFLLENDNIFEKKHFHQNLFYDILIKKGQFYEELPLKMENIYDKKNKFYPKKETYNGLIKILDASPIAVLLINLEGKIIECNQKAVELFKYNKDNFLNINILNFVSDQNRDNVIDILDKIKEKKKLEKKEIILKNSKDENFIAELSGQIIEDMINYSYTIALYINDISDYKETASELIKAKEKAEEADKLKTAFLANMSHEIRTPMNSILGFSELLADDEIDNATRKQYINIITNSGKQLLTIINDIIDLSKIEAGQMSINNTICDINTTLLDIYSQFSNNAVLKEKKNIEFKVSKLILPSKCRVYCDEIRLRQILGNLINNAIKFTHKGFIEFGCELEKDEKLLKFIVKDTGIGLPKEKQHYIFKRFSQLEDPGKRFYRGTGLGLAISLALLKLMKGHIWLDSEEGKGTTFYFTIPNKPAANFQFTTTKPENNENILPDWSNKKIIVAEDENINFIFLKSALKDTNIQIIHAKNGQEAIDFYHKNLDVDLILMDIKMPIMDGLEATGIIKKETPKLPIVAQTAYALNQDKQKINEAGCNDILTKPIRKKALFDMLENFL